MKYLISALLSLSIFSTLKSQIPDEKKKTIITGTHMGLFPAGYTGKINIPFFFDIFKNLKKNNFPISFVSSDSIYTQIFINEPILVSIFYQNIYLLPGDSVHIDFLYEQDDAKRTSRSTFLKVYSKLGFDGNIGYSNFIHEAEYLFQYASGNVRETDIQLKHFIDSNYADLLKRTQNYISTHKVSPDYKAIIFKNLLLDKFSVTMRLIPQDSAGTIQYLKENLFLFPEAPIYTNSYYGAVGSIPAAFNRIYSKEPSKVLLVLKQNLDEENYTYASLIFANKISRELPIQNNPISPKIALEVLERSNDKDFQAFAYSILSNLKASNESNQIIKRTRVMDSKGDTFSMEEVLNEVNAEIKYIDIWASWCMPCIEAMPYSKTLPEKFKNKNIKTVFISIDENREDWMKAVDRLSLPGSLSYCILDSENIESFSKALQISNIPRYLILDSKNNLQSLSVPGPNKIDEDFLSAFIPKDNMPFPPPPPKSK